MAEIICVSSEIPGALYPTVELARRLKVAGHRLIFSSPPGTKKVVVENEIDFLPLLRDGYEDFLREDARQSAVSRLLDLRTRRLRAAEALGLDSMVEQVRRLRPDLVLINGELHEQIIALSAMGARVALLNTFVSIWRIPGMPPPSYLARPGIGWRGSRLGTWSLWQRLRFWKRSREWALRLSHVGCDLTSVLQRLAHERGFDFRSQTDRNQWLMPFTYRTLPVLSMHALEFEFPHHPPERVRYLGPLVLEKRGDDELDDSSRDRLEKLFERRARNGRRIVFAGFGSFFSTDLDFLKRLIKAVGDHDRWDLVISLGGGSEPVELESLPKSVHVFRWLPQLRVLQNADAAVIHGGINTADECVLCGVPMLVYCGFETDMAGTTSRISYHGLGTVGDRSRDGEQAIRERIENLLREPRYRDAVESFRSRYVAYTENRVAERTVGSLLALA